MKTVLESYVPRHVRIGCFVPNIAYQFNHVVVNSVSIVNDDGVVVETLTSRVNVPAGENLSKYKPEDFSIENLTRNGVPLSLVNVNQSQMRTISEIESILGDVERVKSLEAALAAQKSEIDKYFDKSVVES